MLVALLNAFLGAYLLDATLTVADGLGRLAGVTWLALPRDWIARLVFFASPLLLLFALLSPRLPKRALLPLVLGCWWLNLGALPLGPLLAGPLQRDVGLGLLQLTFALPALRFVRRRSGGTAWRFEERLLPEARTDRRRVALVLGLLLLGLPALAALLALGGAVVLVERATGGFVGFAASGLTLDERHYQRGQQEVRLIGMSHVGRKGVYDALLAQADHTPTLILEEGVTDEQGLLPGADVEPLALALGLDPQPRAAEMLGPDTSDADGEVETPEIEHADLDLSAFREGTIEFLRLAFHLANEPDDAEARRAFEALVRTRGSQQLYRELVEDVLEKRNQNLLGRLDRALESHPRVVVPWGALHLPGIEAGVLARGFQLTSVEARSFLPYSAVARGLARAFGGP